jgi:hypothetical protein
LVEGKGFETAEKGDDVEGATLVWDVVFDNNALPPLTFAIARPGKAFVSPSYTLSMILDPFPIVWRSCVPSLFSDGNLSDRVFCLQSTTWVPLAMGLSSTLHGRGTILSDSNWEKARPRLPTLCPSRTFHCTVVAVDGNSGVLNGPYCVFKSVI